MTICWGKGILLQPFYSFLVWLIELLSFHYLKFQEDK